MRIGFKIDRLVFYRLLGPVIELALGSGADVVLFHRDLASDRTGEKRDQYADPTAVPAFRVGSPRVRQWTTERGLYEAGKDERLDALVTLMPFFEAKACRELAREGIAWVSLQEAFEFHHFPVDLLLQPDAVCMFSEWWIDLVARRFPAVPRARLSERLIATGWPELDAFATVDRDRVRARWGIPPGVPVVTLGSYKYHGEDPWEQIAFRPRSLVRAVYQAARHGRPDLLIGRGRGASYDDLLRALRAFCDRNGALLISKSRRKDRPPPLERRLADLSLTDDSYYPPTVVDVCAVTDVFINFVSTIVLEAVYGGALAICPVPPARSWWFSQPDWPAFASLIGYHRPGSIWNFPGTALQIPMDDLMRTLPGMALSDLRPEPGQRGAYVRQFLHADDADHSSRVWDVILRTIDAKRVPAGRSVLASGS